MKSVIILSVLLMGLNINASELNKKVEGSLGSCSIYDDGISHSTVIGTIEIDEDLTARIYRDWRDETDGPVVSSSLENTVSLSVSLTSQSLPFSLPRLGSTLSMEATEERDPCYPKSCGPFYDVTFIRFDVVDSGSMRGNYISNGDGFIDIFNMNGKVVRECNLSREIKDIVLN